ncbi:MAG: glycosyltransferase family 4 protein [Verrucomicrobia bacterium]|nr:glycosyltransferase family 4 protein [Verrucomicrobiota bacterium]
MRLAFVTHEPLYPPTGGGSAELGYLVTEATRRAHETHVIGPKVEHHATVEKEFGVRLHPFLAWEMGRYTKWRNFKYLLYPFWIERILCKLHKELQFDALISQHAISAVAVGRAKRFTGIPIVMNFLDHLTGFMETWPFWRMPPPLLVLLKGYELSMPRRFSADGVLTVSDVLAELLAANGYPADRMCTICYGYDSRFFPLDAGAVARRASLPPTVVMHGSLDHHHLGRIAIDAMAVVAAARPDVVFKFIGHKTPPLQRFQNLARKRGLDHLIRVTGFVPYQDLARELSEATIGWIPYEESSGVHCAFVAKVVEYLGVGLPVASTPLQSIKRYFANEPLVRFSQFDGRDLGKCILSWLAEPTENRNKLARPASERVRHELDWSVISRRALDFIEHTVQQAAATRITANSK